MTADPLETLQQLKPVDSGVSAREISDTLNVHRSSLLALSGDLAAQRQLSQRLAADMERKLADHQRGASVEVIPLGGAAELDRFFLREDGSVRFKRESRVLGHFGGETISDDAPGLLDSASVTPEHERLRRAYGGFAIAFHRARKMGANPSSDLLCRKAYKNFLRALHSLPGRTGDFCRKMLADPEMFKRVIGNAAGSGGELVAVPTVSNIIRPTDLARRIPGMVRMVNAPTPSFKQPIVTGRAIGRRRGATASDPARYTQSQLTTSDTTRTVVDIAFSALLDPQWVTDAATTIDDPMGLVQDLLANGYADTLEFAFLHGDTNAQDTLSSWTLGGYYTAGDLDGTDSPAKFWIGWRGRAFDDSNNYAGGGSFDITDHFGALALMGNLASDARIITGLNCLYTDLLPLTQFLTRDLFGDQATIVTGQLGSIGGKPVIVSQFLANEYASTGLYTGSGTTNTLVYVNPDRYEYYEMDAGAGADFDVIYPERGAQYVGMVRRGILVPNCMSTEKPCAVVVNL